MQSQKTAHRENVNARVVGAGALQLLLCFWISACALPVAEQKVQPSEVEVGMLVRARHAPSATPAGEQVLRDALVEKAITGLAARMEGPTPTRVVLVRVAPEAQPVQVGTDGAWRFSVAVLRGLRFDNELAAAVAAAKALAGTPPEMETSWRAVSRTMVRSLYAAGYDPRGVSSFWKSWAAALALPADSGATHRVLMLDIAAELDEEARNELARLPPLLNPVVRTPEFATIGKRLQKL
jgi:hypothetical protein